MSTGLSTSVIVRQEMHKKYERNTATRQKTGHQKSQKNKKNVFKTQESAASQRNHIKRIQSRVFLQHIKYSLYHTPPKMPSIQKHKQASVCSSLGCDLFCLDIISNMSKHNSKMFKHISMYVQTFQCMFKHICHMSKHTS